MNGRIVAAVVSLMAGACTSVTVDPLPPGVKGVLIVDNPKVIVQEFVEVMRAAFERRGLTTRLVRDEPEASDDVLLTYTARQSWDLGSYLSQAEVVVRRQGKRIAYAEYHLVGGGGLSLMKWDSVPTKMNPVYDELLQHYPVSAP